MSRVFLPSVFTVSWTQGTQAEGAGAHLRWLLHPSAGLPRAHFQVWVRSQVTNRYNAIPVTPRDITGPAIILEWGGDPMAAAQALVTINTGQSLVLRAYDGPAGTGHMVDDITGSPGATVLSVVGSGIRSLTLSGTGRLTGLQAMSMADFVNDPSWVLFERVGLPVGAGWGAGTYPLDNQGRVGSETTPANAAVQRLQRGAPTTGWPATNDRGQAMPAWVAPAHGPFVAELQGSLLAAVREMLERVPEAHKHGQFRRESSVTPPRSIHGAALSEESRALVAPLGSLLAAAGSDPFAALALGFGTFVPATAVTSKLSFTTKAIVLPPNLIGRIMVTVDHDVPVVLPGGKVVTFKTTLADVILNPVAGPAPAATSVTAQREVLRRPGNDGGLRFLDRPNGIDQPYLESVAVRWTRAVPAMADAPSARSYAVTRARGSLAHALLLDQRTSGGHRPFVPVSAGSGILSAPCQLVDRGLPEPVGAEPPGTVYSVTAQDWFGRWAAWASADHVRQVTPPQVPALLRVELAPLGTPAVLQDAAVDIELAWNWADRSPEVITLEAKVHPEGTAPSTVEGTIREIGGPVVASATITFGGSPALPPGVERIDDPASGDVARYRVRLTGFRLAFGTHPRIAATARLKATEHVRPTSASAWSRSLATVAVSGLPPPAPPPPPGMVWGSLPDPGGVARAALTWPTTAGVTYAIYTADETALRRELGLPAADLHVPAHERLLALRGRNDAGSRRAFRRVADGVTVTPYEVELPKGSRLIHFFTAVAVSDRKVESPFSTSSNDWIAVATPRVATLETPRVTARPVPTGVLVEIELPPGQPAPTRVELHRTRLAAAVLDLDRMGPPVATTAITTPAAGWQISPLPGGGHRLRFTDTAAPANWAPLWYRAVSWCDSNLVTGLLASRSPASAPFQTTRPASTAPVLTLAGTPTRSAPDQPVLVRWSSSLPPDRTPAGVSAFRVVGRQTTATVTRSANADEVRTYVGALPTPDQATPIFRHHASDPALAQYAAWIDLPPSSPIQIVVQAIDPAGRTTTANVELP
jgi:hypothetical protein